MPTMPQVQLPDWTKSNYLFDNGAIAQQQAGTALTNAQAGLVGSETDTSQQNLADRASLRGIAGGLAARDPGAIGTAASMPVGVPSINALGTYDSQTAASKLALGQYANTLPQNPFRQNSLSNLGPGAAGNGNASAYGSGDGSADDQFLDQMSTVESSGNPQAVNKSGYSGNFQFGTARLADLSLYQPVQGESLKGNHWQGTFNIPGFSQVQTHQDFLNNPYAQRMAAEVHFKDIGNAIDNTPGAQDFNRNGLLAVAQLGGIGGMQQFVASGGQYSPHDNNGTSLVNYYNRFSQGGIPALKEGAPAGYGVYMSPDGQTGFARLPGVQPQMSRVTTRNPDGSVTMYDNTGNPIGTTAPNSRDVQIQDYQADRKASDEIAEAGNQAQSNQIRLAHALDLAQTLKTGAGGGSRSEWANLAQTYLPDALAKQFTTSLVGDGGPAAAQQFDKLMVQSAGSQERGVLGARGGYQATQLFMKANPGMEMQPEANQRILNMQLIGQQADADYSQGALAHFNQNADSFRSGGSYTPLAKFYQQWLGQRNPQIYASAMAAAAGDPWQKWTQGLNMKSPDDVKRVVDIVRRAKPGSQIQWANGAPQTVDTQ